MAEAAAIDVVGTIVVAERAAVVVAMAVGKGAGAFTEAERAAVVVGEFAVAERMAVVVAVAERNSRRGR